MTCRYCQPLLSPYIDGVLSSQERQEIQTHLFQCLACTKQLQQLEKNRLLVRALPAAAVTKEMEAQLLTKIQSSKAKVQDLLSSFLLLTPYSLRSLQSTIRNWPMLSYGTVATCAASVLFYFAMMQIPPTVSAEEVVSSMDELIGTLDPDEGERAITEETPDEVVPDWSDELDRDLFENENEQD